MKKKVTFLLLVFSVIGLVVFYLPKKSKRIVVPEIKRNVTASQCQMYWFIQIASETENVTEAWASPFIHDQYLNETYETIYNKFPESQLSFKYFFQTFFDPINFTNTNQLSFDFIERILKRQKKIELIAPPSFPDYLKHNLESGVKFGGSIGHGPHDILISVKSNLIKLLSRSNDSRFVKTVMDEFFRIQKHEGFCGWGSCYVMDPFIGYVNQFCPICMSVISPKSHCEKCIYYCEKCQASFTPKLVGEPSHYTMKKINENK